MTNATSVVSAPAPPGRLHLAHVDSLRALAALVVYVNHAYAQAGFPGHEPGAPWLLRVFARSMVTGHLAVSVFIVISGFCLTLPVVDAGDKLRGGLREFMKRRSRRILPPYYGALLLSLGLIATVIGEPTGSLWDVAIQFDWKPVVSHFLLLHDLFGTGRINYVFWSIAVEWHIYLVFPLLVLATKRFGVVRMAIAALLIGYALRFGFADTRLARANPHFLGLFALGMFAAYVVRSPLPRFQAARASAVWFWVSAAVLGLVIVLLAYLGYDEPEKYFPYLDFPVALFATTLLVHTSARAESRATRILNFPGTVFVGVFSYSLYLVHAPLLQLMWQYGVRPLGVSTTTAFELLGSVGLVLVLLVAYGFFWVFERPFLRAGRRVVKAEPAPAPVTP